ncbi:hypothetical protein [Arcobacter sp.]|uniref:hypothetical protein n=1 Tax=Arcobacter sp. TaxID=1872629 RepID=UPI003D0E3DDD
MERNEILLVGKKIIKGLLVGSIVLASAQADFLMTLTDKNGVEENLCVKSYSFSNNMESLHKEVKQMKDVYSTEETLTNKIWMDKPVYRKIFNNVKIIDGVHQFYPTGITNVEHITKIDMTIYDTRFNLEVQGHNYLYQPAYYKYSDNTIAIDGRSKTYNDRFKLNFILEYTKITDTAQTNTNELTTLVHYLPSDSTNGGYITKSTKNLKIGFFENYTYDASTNSCIAPTN